MALEMIFKTSDGKYFSDETKARDYEHKLSMILASRDLLLKLIKDENIPTDVLNKYGVETLFSLIDNETSQWSKREEYYIV